MASFNFDKFETEFETRQMMGNVLNILRDLRDPANGNQRLIPADEGTPLHSLMTKLRVGEEAPPEEFDFELGNHLTIAQATRQCAQGNAHMPEMLTTIAGRVYFNRSLNRRNPDWVEISRPESADTGAEILACHFLNQERTVIDWQLSMPELKRLAQTRLYTAEMMQNSLLHLVDRFCKEQKDLIRNLNANQIANYLLSMERNRDKSSYRRKELSQVTRKPGQELKAPLAVADRLIDQIYPADRPELAVHRSQAKRIAIVSFLPDELALPLLNKMNRSMEKCSPLSDETILKMANEAEEASRIMPAFDLKFGRHIGAMPAANHIQFNSVLSGNVPPTNHYGLPPRNPYGDPFANQYPPILPVEDWRPAVVENTPPPAQQQAARAATAAQQQKRTAAKKDNGPQAHSTPAQQSARQPPGTPLRPNEEQEFHTPLQASNEETIVNSARRNLLTESLLETDDLIETLSGGQANEVTDLTEENPNEGFTEVVSRKTKRNSTPKNSGSGVQTRTQIAQAIGGQVSLSSIGLEKQVTPEVLAMAVTLVEACYDSQKGLDGAKALAKLGAKLAQQDMSYNRGQVQDGRYSSKDRGQSNAGQTREGRTSSRGRDQSNRDQSRGRDSSRYRDQSSRGQSRDRYPSRDRIRSNEDRRYPSRDRNQQWSDSRSRSKESWNQRSQSRGQDSRSYRDRSNADRSYSRDRPQSYRRTESRSPARGNERTSYSNESRPSRSSDSRGRSSRTSSQEIRSIYKRMDRGVNCRSDYDPSREKSCTKCTTPGHHEFECDTYYRYTSKKCPACKKGNHFADKCMEVERFPPNPGDGRSMELGKN